jgi:N-acetylneuraminic acid mutarotase
LTNGKVLVVGGLGTNETSIPTADLYQPIQGLWSATGGTILRRNAHSATLLSNGRVLVAGGLDQQSGSGSVHATAEIYKPLLGTWALTDDMSTPRARHSATRLLNGKVLVVGGFSDVEVLATAELYDPGSTTWSVTSEMATPRYGHTATRLPNGQVLVAGGYDEAGKALETAELFTPASGSWSATGSMATARAFPIPA